MERIERIEQALRDAFDPAELRVKDQSHLHAGHAGAREGLGHFDVFIVSDAFKGVARVRRHQMVYAAMGEMMQTDIHALAIRARAVDE
ncbi:MAG: BolA family protein [Pseudomonadota bacterium]